MREKLKGSPPSFKDIAIIAASVVVLSTVMWPALANQTAEAKRSQLMARLTKTGMGAALYVESWDQHFPLQAPIFEGQYIYQQFFEYPDGWRKGSDPLKNAAVADAWPNSLQTFWSDPGILEGPGFNKVALPRYSLEYKFAVKPVLLTSITFNGLLSEYASSEIVAPEKLPLFWNGFGRGNMWGAATSNPVMTCSNPVPEPCKYQAKGASFCAWGNGSTSQLYMPYAGNMYAHLGGSFFIHADTSVSHVPLGATLAPEDTDFNVDPYTEYSSDGYPQYFWYDGCHAFLFRPDFDFSRQGGS